MIIGFISQYKKDSVRYLNLWYLDLKIILNNFSKFAAFPK